MRFMQPMSRARARTEKKSTAFFTFNILRIKYVRRVFSKNEITTINNKYAYTITVSNEYEIYLSTIEALGFLL